MSAERAGLGSRPAHLTLDQEDRFHRTAHEWPRPACEIRDELVALAVDAYDEARTIDPARLEQLAQELHQAAALIVMYGGDNTTTAALAAAVEETAELARLTRVHRLAVAA